MPKRSPKPNTSASSAPPDPQKGAATAREPFVVGIGASAGGLQAPQTFFGAIKDPLHAAFVVIQHLSPDFKSFMVELLARHTRMTVQRAEQGARVQAGNIYLIPPKVTLTIAQGRLRLEKTDPRRGLHLPIDQFFFSLAQDQQHRGVAIILSGTGSDGTAGIRAVKEAGTGSLLHLPAAGDHREPEPRGLGVAPDRPPARRRVGAHRFSRGRFPQRVSFPSGNGIRHPRPSHARPRAASPRPGNAPARSRREPADARRTG